MASGAALPAMDALRAMPVIRTVQGGVQAGSVAAARDRVERVAHARMAHGELGVFLHNAVQLGLSTWRAQQSVFGRLRNVFGSGRPGYVQVPGRILRQVCDLQGIETRDEIEDRQTYLLRLDAAKGFLDDLDFAGDAAGSEGAS
ncbi:hypothetical protein [Roseovarius sp.]|uniref:hypothetical protein n=1 Tax=Roseovarius sp. TaxID=1486281 RepID=UPI003B5B4B33